MRTLKDRLDAIRTGFKKKAPVEVLGVMDRARQELAYSGIMARIPQIGDSLPAFVLSDTDGATVDMKGLLAQGPVVITFYRGVW